MLRPRRPRILGIEAKTKATIFCVLELSSRSRTEVILVRVR